MNFNKIVFILPHASFLSLKDIYDPKRNIIRKMYDFCKKQNAYPIIPIGYPIYFDREILDIIPKLNIPVEVWKRELTGGYFETAFIKEAKKRGIPITHWTLKTTGWEKLGSD